MTATILQRAEALIARAAHEATPVEEARTCGVLLAKLIVAHGLELREQEPQREQELPAQGRWIRSRFDTGCRRCARAVRSGDSVYWVKNKGVTCRPCAEALARRSA